MQGHAITDERIADAKVGLALAKYRTGNAQHGACDREIDERIRLKAAWLLEPEVEGSTR